MVKRGGFERHPRSVNISTKTLPSLQSPIQIPPPPCSFPDFLHAHNNNNLLPLCSQTTDLLIKLRITFFLVVKESNFPLSPLNTPRKQEQCLIFSELSPVHRFCLVSQIKLKCRKAVIRAHGNHEGCPHMERLLCKAGNSPALGMLKRKTGIPLSGALQRELLT